LVKSKVNPKITSAKSLIEKRSTNYDMSFDQKKYLILLACFLRTYLINSVFNLKGLQSIGFLYALDPGLKQLYPDSKALNQARRRYLTPYNCNYFFLPLLIGLFLHCEQLMCNQQLSVQQYQTLKATTISTLSAIGDSFFSGSLIPCWSLCAALLISLGWYNFLIFFIVFSVLFFQLVRLYFFYLGYTKGLLIVVQLKKWNLINWGQYLKFLNLGLILSFVLLNLPLGFGHLWDYVFILVSFVLIIGLERYFDLRKVGLLLLLFWIGLKLLFK